VSEDQTWLQQMQRGEPEGLHRIYERYKDDLVTIAAGLLVDRGSAEDCLHDVFVHLATHDASGICLHGTLKGYLITCVVNRARDMLRRRRRMEPASLAELAEMRAASDEPAAQAAIRREEAARLYEALSELPYEQREVIVLRLHGALTFEEISRQLVLSINTVQSRYRYGLEKLRAQLNAGAEL
jgi:RNA polymerase sigma-70 factor (ECF subfamily)